MATIFGDTSGSLTGTQKGKDQILVGVDNQDNTLVGDANTITDHAKRASDTLIGGNNSGVDSIENDLFGDAFTMSGFAHGGNDIVSGGDDNESGDVTNVLDGDADNLAAGQTVVIFNFVEDFSQTQHDVIEFSGVAGVTSFANLSFDTTTDPGSTIIHAGADQVTLVGFTGTLTAHDFLIV